MDYASLPAMVQFALVDVEAHTHLVRVEQASRMWRTVATELQELSDSLRHELDRLQPQWTDGTGAEFVRQVARRKASIDEMLTRITEHQPWRALDDLARQLLLTRARVTDTAERSTDTSQHEAAAHLAELDSYFLAAAEAVLAAAGGDERAATLTVPAAANGPLADECCSAPSAIGPVLASGLGPNLTPSVALDPVSGSSLPPGSVSIPGLVAVPPGSSAGGKYGTRNGADGTPAASQSPVGRTFDPSTISGGSLPGASSLDASGPDIPSRIEQAANPVSLTGPQSAPEAPQPPEPLTGTKPGSQRAPGGLFPPMMMMPPMVPGAGRSSIGRRSAHSLEGSERRPKTPPTTPGVPPRLQGRSALADPAGSGYRPVVMSGTKNGTKEPAAAEALDHEVWQVANPGAASPLKPEAVEPEQPRRLRRPRL